MNKVIIILGPTGVGKTGVSILLAKELKTEIISADSMQIYRHMDIGTAKPSIEEKTTVKHHMIDIVDPWESYSTGKYIAEVVPIIDKLHRKGKIPIVVGGTGLYIKAMTRGIFSGPPADWNLREELLSMDKEERGSLYNYLKEFDPDAAEKITPNDTRRVIRALEVCLKSNACISELQKKLTQPLPYDFIKIGLTRDRKELYRIIEERVAIMIKSGLIEEVENILAIRPDRTPLQAIGYKEIAMYMDILL
jgi:tRNA dimethylallyltransferase